MEKNRKEIEENFKLLKYEYSQLKDNVSDDIRLHIESNIAKAREVLEVIFPAVDEVAFAIQGVMYSHYPEFATAPTLYLKTFCKEVCDYLSEMIVKQVNGFLHDLETNNTSYIQSEDQLRELVAFFAKPLDESPESDSTEVSNKENESNPTENTQTNVEVNKRINKEKTEFLAAIHSVLFRYFGERLDKLDTRGWNLIGITLGHTYLTYMKHSYILMYLLAEGYLNENPGMSFFEYEKKFIENTNTDSATEPVILG